MLKMLPKEFQPIESLDSGRAYLNGLLTQNIIIGLYKASRIMDSQIICSEHLDIKIDHSEDAIRKMCKSTAKIFASKYKAKDLGCSHLTLLEVEKIFPSELEKLNDVLQIVDHYFVNPHGGSILYGADINDLNIQVKDIVSDLLGENLEV